ncbi:MAG TPA: CheR family methyltransferase [Rhodopseudomonas sp.]|uniref:CheR family methyltransferase n=1 Tax=Rhodopseudomonas sp. TaxID=1078 RepID=UPI002EDA8F9E
MIEPLPRLSDRHFRAIAELVEQQVGIRLPENKRLMLEGRLQKRVRMLGYGDINEYVDHLFDDDHFDTELIHLIDCVTTNKTDFFREPFHFDFLREIAVPELLRRARGRPLKIWSAACSTGMEAYTIAIVLDDMQRTGGASFQFRILGTDISTGVLQLAEEGIYTKEMIAPVPDAMAKRYFLSSKDKSRSEVRIVPELRRSVAFMRMNLMDAVYPVDRDVDVIFCRNVLIYFDKPTQSKVVERLCSHLRPGGYLIVGHSESMIQNQSIKMKQLQPTIFKV